MGYMYIDGSETWNSFPSGMERKHLELDIFPTTHDPDLPLEFHSPLAYQLRELWKPLLTSPMAVGACFAVSKSVNPNTVIIDPLEDKQLPYTSSRLTSNLAANFERPPEIIIATSQANEPEPDADATREIYSEILRWGCAVAATDTGYHRVRNGIEKFFRSNLYLLYLTLKAPYSTRSSGTTFALFCIGMFVYTFTVQPAKVALFIVQTLFAGLTLGFKRITRFFGSGLYRCGLNIVDNFKTLANRFPVEAEQPVIKRGLKQAWKVLFVIPAIIASIPATVACITIAPFWLTSYCLKVSANSITSLCINLPHFVDGLLMATVHTCRQDFYKARHALRVVWTSFKSLAVTAAVITTIAVTGGTSSPIVLLVAKSFGFLKGSMVSTLSMITAKGDAALTAVIELSIWSFCSQAIAAVLHKCNDPMKIHQSHNVRVSPIPPAQPSFSQQTNNSSQADKTPKSRRDSYSQLLSSEPGAAEERSESATGYQTPVIAQRILTLKYNGNATSRESYIDRAARSKSSVPSDEALTPSASSNHGDRTFSFPIIPPSHSSMLHNSPGNTSVIPEEDDYLGEPSLTI